MSEAKLAALYDRLMAAGSNRRHLSIQGTGATGNDDVERLENENGEWIIAYWERGQRRKIEYRSHNLDDAIRYYEDSISRIRHDHCIALTRDLSEMASLELQLKSHNITFHRNDVPNFNGPNDRLYRLYVIGKEIFKIKNIYGREKLIDYKR